MGQPEFARRRRLNFMIQARRYVHAATPLWLKPGKKWPGSYEVSHATWIERHSVENKTLVTALENDLDLGESETIALALELQADLVLLDEKEG